MEDRMTSLSAGLAVYAMLAGDGELSGMVTKIFPVATDEAELPYIAYRRVSLENTAVKTGIRGTDTVRVEVACYAASYADGVRIAEAVRRTLEGKRYRSNGLEVRMCLLADAAEEWQDDAFVQRLSFDLKV